jgi:hypothetical protein
MEKYKKLIREYISIKNDLLDYTESFHDGMLFDIEGYIEAFSNQDYDEINELENQVKSFRLILEGFKGIKYVFC